LAGGGTAGDLSWAVAETAESTMAITVKIAAARTDIDVARLAGIG
jgi:hypothetical protein